MSELTTATDLQSNSAEDRNATFDEVVLPRLSPRSRELLRRRELERLSYLELARAMNVPIGTVMPGLSRARRALKQALAVRSTAGTCVE